MASVSKTSSDVAVRVAVIGVRHWHSLWDAAYLPALAMLPDVQLVGIQDDDPSIVRSRAEAVQNPPTFTDYRQMLKQVKPDLVFTLGRHADMAEAVGYVIDSGYPQVAEKPVGVSAEQVRMVTEKAEAANLFVTVPFPWRVHPAFTTAAHLIASGALGELSHIYLRCIRPSYARYVSWDCEWMLDAQAAGGGALRNIGPHFFDILLKLADEEAAVESAQLNSTTVVGVEDYASVHLRTASGVIATVEVGNLFPMPGTDGEIKIVGSGGTYIARNNVITLITRDGEKTQQVPTPDMTSVWLRDALARWHRDDPPLSEIRDCYNATLLIDRAYKVASLPPGPGSPGN
jgi:predicted dehydrogenase